MDQEREKLARLRDAALCALGPWADQPVVSDETTRAELVRNVSAALEQWGDLRAEQVRRETVEEAVQALHDHGEPQAVEALRRAFAASQGGTT